MFGLFGNDDSKANQTVTTGGPPKWLDKYFKDLYGQSFDLVGNGNYPQPYSGPTYAGSNPALRQAWNQTAQIAGGRNPFGGLPGYANRMIQRNGMTPAMTRAMQPLHQIASGRQGIQVGDNVRRMALGQMIGESNPYLMNNLNTAATEAADQVGAQFAGSGRYGSGANQNVIAQNTGRIFSEGLGAQMNQDIQNSLAANQAWTGVQGANIANRAGAANSIQGHLTGGAQRANQLAALAPVLNDMRYAGADRLANMGAQQQAISQGRMSDAQRRWNESQGRNVNALSWLQSMLSGTPYTVQTQQQPQGSPIAGLLGGALAGGAVGAKVPGVGPWGAGIGAGLGGLAGLFM